MPVLLVTYFTSSLYFAEAPKVMKPKNKRALAQAEEGKIYSFMLTQTTNNISRYAAVFDDEDEDERPKKKNKDEGNILELTL